MDLWGIWKILPRSPNLPIQGYIHMARSLCFTFFIAVNPEACMLVTELPHRVFCNGAVNFFTLGKLYLLHFFPDSLGKNHLHVAPCKMKVLETSLGILRNCSLKWKKRQWITTVVLAHSLYHSVSHHGQNWVPSGGPPVRRDTLDNLFRSWLNTPVKMFSLTFNWPGSVEHLSWLTTQMFIVSPVSEKTVLLLQSINLTGSFTAGVSFWALPITGKVVNLPVSWKPWI